MQDLLMLRDEYLRSGAVPAGVRPVVSDSWQRCRNYGVSPESMRPQVANPEHLAGARAANARLLASAEPLLNHVHQTLGKQPHVVALSDPEGCILRLLAESSVATHPASVAANLFEGASWHEQDIGCNGIGTCLAVGKPIVLIGPEHFQNAYLDWTCIGVPLRGTNGEIIGALDLSVPNQHVRTEFWGWVLSLGKQMEARFACGAEELLETVPEALLVQEEALSALSGITELLLSQLNLPPTHARFIEDVSRAVAAAVAERQRASEALLKREQRLRKIFDANAVGLLLGDFEGRILEANDAFLKTIGYTREDFEQGRINWVELTPPEHRPLDRAAMEQMIEAGQHEPFQKEYLRKDGTRVPVLVGTAYLPGEKLGVGFIVDVTERKQAEHKLRENEENFRTLAENISQLAWMADAKGWIFWYNKRWFEYTGTTLEEMEGWGWQAVHHPEHVQRVTEKIRHCFETGEIWEDTFPLRGKDGQYRWFLSRAVPVRDATGQILRWFGTNTDVTELRETEAALHLAVQRFETLANMMPQIVWSTRPDGYHDYFNDRWYEFTGMPREGDQGWNWKDYLHPQDVAPTLEVWRRSLATGEPYEVQYRFRRASDGLYRWFIARALPIRDPEGNITRWFGTCTEITELLETQRALRESEERHRLLFENMSEGFALCEMVWDPQGKPVDFRYLQVNQAWFKHTGLPEEQTIGRTIREVIPGIEPYWIETYARVVCDGQPISYENFAATLGKWFETYAFKHSENCFALLFRNITERKRSEERAAELKRKVDAALLAGEIGTFEWRVREDRLWGDRNFSRIFPIELDDDGSAPLAKYIQAIHPDDRSEVAARINRTLETGRPYEAEYRIISHGATRWVVVRGVGEQDETGRVVRFPGVIMDITERKQQQEELRRAHALLDGIAAGTQDLIAAQDAEFRYTYFNDAYRREFKQLWGRDIELGTSMVEALAPWPEEQRLAVELWRRALNGETFNVTMEFGPGTEKQIYDLRFNPVLNAQRKRIGAAHFLRNVTEQVRTQQLLRESEAKFRAFFETVAVGTAQTDFNGNFIEVNDRYCEITGYSREELLGMTALDLSPPDELAAEREKLTAYFTGQTPVYDTEKRYIRKDGSPIWVHVTAALIRQANSDAIRSAGIVQDITKRKQAEAALAEAQQQLKGYAANLERAVAERTAALRETNQHMEAFSYTIAHDLRAPLRAQQGFANALLEEYGEALGPTGRDYAERIIASATRLNDLISDLLNFSRISRTEMQLDRLDLQKVVSEICAEMEFQIHEAKAKVRLENLCFHVCGHELTLRAAVTNLISNALKFCRPGTPPAVHIFAEERAKAVRLWVEDDGIGIAPEHHHQIFGVFHRLHRAGEYGGTGVGLAIVQKGIERMGGRVGVESEEGKGSRFWIELENAT